MIHRKIGVAGLLLLLFGACAALAMGQDQVPIGEGGTTGDNPLTTSFTFTGNVGLAIDVVPFAGFVANNPGTFVISIPAGSTVLKALMYVQRWDDPATNASAVLSGSPLGPIAAFVTDPAGNFLLQAYRFDVTGIVTGSGNYPFTFDTSGGQNYYAALVVVFSHRLEPVGTILINDGSEAIGTGPSTTAFSGVGGGAGTLTIVTQADNSGTSGESIVFNGATILGPGDIFNANLGDFASLFQLPVTVAAGTNTASITTFGDLFGWHLAILVASSPTEADCSGFPCGNNDNKVLLCHVPPGNPGNAHTLCISPNAVAMHLENHEDDHCGPCGDGGPLFQTGVVQPCPDDVNGDGVTNVLDLIDLLLCFGQPAFPGCEAKDVNQDGTVNVLDLIDLLLAFGTACP